MEFNESSVDKFTSFDGLGLDVHIWEAEEPKAILMAIHGGLAHGGDYVTIGTYFKAKGYTTASYDLRGHKQEKIKLKNFNDYVEDTVVFLEWLKKRYPDKPVFIIGHSMGSNIATLLGIEKLSADDTVKGYILSSPYYGNAIKVPGIMIALSSLLAKIIPNAKLPTEDLIPNLTHDEEITNRHRKDEESGIRGKIPTIRFGSQLLKSQKWITNNIHKWNKKIMFIVAGDDKLADVEITNQNIEKIDPKYVTKLYYEGNYHENFNELNREEIFSKMEKWMDEILQS